MAFWIERKVEPEEIIWTLHTRMFNCSECGGSQGYGTTPFCMYCGAKMDKGAMRRKGDGFEPVPEKKWTK